MSVFGIQMANYVEEKTTYTALARKATTRMIWFILRSVLIVGTLTWRGKSPLLYPRLTWSSGEISDDKHCTQSLLFTCIHSRASYYRWVLLLYVALQPWSFRFGETFQNSKIAPKANPYLDRKRELFYQPIDKVWYIAIKHKETILCST